MATYVITGIVLLCYLVVAWFVGTMMGLSGARLWVLRGALAIIGIVAAGVFLWFDRKVKKEQAGVSGPIDATAAAELDLLLQQANQKLKQSPTAPATSLAQLPIVYVIGDTNSAKTTVIQHCGLEPDLLAGQAGHDIDSPPPTSSINVWLARRTIFIEAGGKLCSNPQLWARLISKTQASAVSLLFRKTEAPARATIVCFDNEKLCASADTAINTARKLASRLREMASLLGSSFPVYVLFTKLDRLRTKSDQDQFFTSYVSSLTQEESGQVLGATVVRRNVAEGLFREEETKRLSVAFDQLVYSLAERRTEYLSRETKPEALPSIYEFPRDFFKLRRQFVDVLVELTRPTELGVTAFLRGFYFTGVRPVVISETQPEARAAAAAQAPNDSATRMFNLRDVGAPTAQPLPSVRSRKVPEWAFLPHLFNQVILRDRSALSASARSTRSDWAQRILLLSVSACFLLLAILFTVSYSNNRQLDRDIARPALALTSVPTMVPSDVPTVEQLNQLDQLRQSLLRIEGFRKDGVPWSYRLGLYVGNDVYPDARRLYFEGFRKLLLAPVQTTLVAQLKQLPVTATPADEFGEPYKSLKAYLITTANHDKSTVEFLAPVLLARWSAGKTLEPERLELAKKQFEYYSAQIVGEDPFSSAGDDAAVQHARNYLKQFSGIERVYQSMLADAARNNPSINFNRRYPGSAQVLINPREVNGAFTKGGFTVMQAALQNPEKYYGAEEWVLGAPSSINIPKEQLQEQLRARYTADYLGQWRTFLKSATLVRYSNGADAVTKLSILSGNGSPLMQLFWLAADNTKVELPNSAKAFDSVQRVAAGAAEDRPIGAASQPYMTALIGLQGSLASLAANPGGAADPAASGQVLSAASAARNSVGQISQTFLVDSDAHLDAQVRKLMEDPITAAEALVRGLGPEKLNGDGKAFCGQFNALAKKYPFDPQAGAEASLQELSDMLQPGKGAFWMFYESGLKTVVARQGNQFFPNPAANMKISPQFIAFMNRVASFADAVYPGGSPQPNLNYTVRQTATYAIDKLSLSVDGQVLSGNGQSRKFAWTGNPASVIRPSGNYPGGTLPFPDVTGTWAPFHFFQNAPRTTVAGNNFIAEWPLEFGRNPIKAPDGTPLVVRYEIENGLIFSKPYMAGMHCPAVGAR